MPYQLDAVATDLVAFFWKSLFSSFPSNVTLSSLRLELEML